MLKLGLEILNGGRSGTKFTLPDKQTSEQKSLPFITENESIKFKLEVNPEVLSAAILLYDIRIDFTNVVIDNEKQIKSFYWEPKSGYFGNGYEALFKNYFGVAELQIELEDSETSKLVELHPLEVLASKLSAERVEKMLKFLSAHNSQEIYSAFHATKRRASLAEGDQEPDMALEKLELITQFLEERVPQICHSPITRLTPKRTITDYHENLYPDESSIAWLSENLSVLRPTDQPEKAVLSYDESYYTTDTLQIPIIQESSNLYENQVVHGFLQFILQEARYLSKGMEVASSPDRNSLNNENGQYKSFFDIMSRFSKDILEPKKAKCALILRKLEFLQYLLNQAIPVREVIRNRPHITPKVKFNRHYLALFRKAISWHEHKRADWSAYENLFGIQNIPKLFETYCLYRILQALKHLLCHEKGFMFFDNSGTQVELLNEPEYWMVGNNNGFSDKIVNSEGWTISRNKKSITKRKISGIYCKRVPDFVIKITSTNETTKLLVFDAKYSKESLSFTEHLPQLTMKYVHGLHSKNSGQLVTTSLSILCPSDSGLVRSFHHDRYAFDGEAPAQPALQVIGLIPSEEIEDNLITVVEKLLVLNKVKLIGDTGSR